MDNQSIKSDESSQIVAVGFWLPCGRGNFYHEIADKKLLNGIRLKSNNIQCSVFRRLFEVFEGTKLRNFFPVYPKFRRSKSESDPEGVVFYSGVLDQITEFVDIGIEKIALVSNDKGFNVLFASTTNLIDEVASKRIKEFLIDFLAGGISKTSSINTGIKEIKEDVKLYKGILTFFQLNLILEGLFNSNFDSRKFFGSSANSTSANDINTDYSLDIFSRKVIAKTIEISQKECLLVQKFFCEQTQLSAENMHDGIFGANFLAASNIVNEILREFLRRVSTDCLLSLKSNIESCRRTLLNGMLSSIHKQDELEQLESKDANAKASYMEGANETQLKGYAMLIAAKLPLILNVNRYIEIIYNSYKFQKDRDEIEFLFKDWFGLVHSIDENISRLEEAIEQSRMDNLLLEQQQIRTENETMAEIQRVRQRNGDDGDGGGSAIALTNNHIAIMAVLIAIILFLKLIRLNKDGSTEDKEAYIILFKGLIPWAEKLSEWFIQFPHVVFSATT